MKKIALILFVLIAIGSTSLTMLAESGLSDSATTVHIGETRTVMLDNGYSAEINFSVESITELDLFAPAMSRSKFTSTMNIKNFFEMTILTLNAVGVFDTNGVITAPVSAYGSGSTGDVSNPSNELGPRQFSSWVKVNLTGSVPGNVSTFDYTCTISCDANQKSTATWE